VTKNTTVTLNIDEQQFKTIDKKELIFRLKKKKTMGFFGGGLLDEKKFRLADLGMKCDMSKDVKSVSNSSYNLKFSIHTPIRGKEYEEVKSQKLVIDKFITPFRDDSQPKSASPSASSSAVSQAQPKQPAKPTEALQPVKKPVEEEKKEPVKP